MKKYFDLIYKNDTNVFNVFPHSDNTLSAYKIDEDDRTYLLTLTRAYEKSRPTDVGRLLSSYIPSTMFVNIEEYPLPGFITKDGTPVVNLAILGVNDLSDYNSNDIYALAVYANCLKFLSGKNVFNKSDLDLISTFLLALFMKFFGKRAGLIGSYKNLIPVLSLLINLYVYEGLLENNEDKSFIKKMSSIYSVDINKINLDYDFSSIKDFLQSLNDNRIISISENKFSNTVINVVGISALPIFEDLSRLFATMLSSTIVGNKVFSNYWIKSSKHIYNRLIDTGIRKLKRNI